MSRITIQLATGSRIFVLEDDHLRMEWFRSKMPDLIHAKTANQAIEILVTDKTPFDMIFLDHDLSILDQKYTLDLNAEKDGNTGSRVAKSMAEGGYIGEYVVIHSWNPAGAANMARLLENGVHILPFGSFDITWGDL